MQIREETLDIFKNSFGVDAAYKVMEYIDSRVRDDVATQKDVYEIKLEIEKVHAEIEKVRADLKTEIEKIRAEMQKSQVSLLKWIFGFWLTQVVLLAGILFKLLG